MNSQIEKAADCLRQGGVVAFPTETVYGLGANALDPMAVAKIYSIKGRPLSHPLILHAATIDDALSYARTTPPHAEKLAQAFWPGPLTLVLPKAPHVPELVTAGLDSIAIRVPAHPVARELITAAGVPIAAPSANRFGGISPTHALHLTGIEDKVDFILTSEIKCAVGVESTIVSFLGDRPLLLRHGGLTLEQIRQWLPDLQVATANEKTIAPGMLAHHYAPRTPLRWAQPEDITQATTRSGLLLFHSPPPSFPGVVVELSHSGNLAEAAANLYSALHHLDKSELDEILVLPFPEEGLGLAINDRLTRAAHP